MSHCLLLSLTLNRYKMIRILPTTESGLTAAAYEVELPKSIFPLQARPERVRTTLSGKALVARWQKRQDGARVTVDLSLNDERFERLLAITEHETVYTWLVISLGRRYLCTVDILSATPATLPLASISSWSVQAVFTVVERLV
jgi:hypothetical protein